ncbi:MAG TPA: carboxymethylenebutenolidase [Gammaproteobacteria bacterium]|nr:carboxymethylenebutenolidase [Gammaproteobacteria bacterium]|tara:strand:- start:916 stop:1647 length:732 start_codon:yes stop_codon:yes gene_type:complete
MIEKYVDYVHNDVTLEGYLAFDGQNILPRPTVLIAHTWEGRGEFVCDKARKLAGQGYAAFAIDLYGKGVIGSGPEENGRLMQPFLDDRPMLQERMLKALEAASSLDVVDNKNIAAIGYCFGGLCVLDLARVGANVRGVVSFHGLLSQPGNTHGKPITAKTLVLHGHDDPMAPIKDVIAIEKEFTAAGADWQINVYGNTMHSFTNPHANDPAMGTVYNSLADRRSWDSLKNFLRELFEKMPNER